MPEWNDLVTKVLSAGALFSGIAAIWGVRNSRKMNVSGDEREARHDEQEQRRDTVADRDSLIDQMQEQLGNLSRRVDRLDAELEDERDYTRLLIDHIYRGSPPPPPPRPGRRPLPV
jgi:TolA-binding protein